MFEIRLIELHFSMRIAYSEMGICLFVMRYYIAFNNNNNKNNIGEIGPSMASHIALEEKDIEMPW